MSSVGIWKFRSELNDLNVPNYFFIITIIPVRIEGIPWSSLNSDGLWSNSDRFRSDGHKFQMIFVDYDKRINDPDELAITTNSESDLIVNAPPPEHQKYPPGKAKSWKNADFRDQTTCQNT